MTQSKYFFTHLNEQPRLRWVDFTQNRACKTAAPRQGEREKSGGKHNLGLRGRMEFVFRFWSTFYKGNVGGEAWAKRLNDQRELNAWVLWSCTYLPLPTYCLADSSVLRSAETGEWLSQSVKVLPTMIEITTGILCQNTIAHKRTLFISFTTRDYERRMTPFGSTGLHDRAYILLFKRFGAWLRINSILICCS